MVATTTGKVWAKTVNNARNMEAAFNKQSVVLGTGGNMVASFDQLTGFRNY